MSEITKKRVKGIFWSLFAFFALIYTLQAVLNHYFFRTYALDYGYYNQAFWDFAHFRTNANTVTLNPLTSFFQIHPGFTLLILSPLYWLFNPLFGTYSLLIIQNIFIVLGGYGVYLFLLRKTENQWIALLAFLHYNLLWGHYSAISADFIETTVAASTIPLFLLFFERKKFLIASLFFLFLITCKENMPIWFMFIALLLILTYKDKTSRLIALGMGIFSFAYLIFMFKFLIPHFAGPGWTYGGFAYAALGKNPGEALIHVLRHPLDSITMMFVNQTGDPSLDHIKSEFYLVFLLSGGILLLCRPVYIIPFIPLIAQKMLNDSSSRWGILGFYSIEAVSLLTLSVFLATSAIRNIKFKYWLYGLLCISTLGITLEKLSERKSLWYDRNKEDMLWSSFYKQNYDVQKVRNQIRAFVPEGIPVAASQCIVPHLAQRPKISVFPYVRDADYIILLQEGNKFPLSEAQFLKEQEKYLNNPEWLVLLNDYPLVILRKRCPHACGI